MGFVQRWRRGRALSEREMAMAEKRLAIEARILESLDITTSFVDPADALKDPETGELWDPLGSLLDSDGKTVTSIAALKAMRKTCRLLAGQNPYAINGHENRVSYIVGTGHEYVVTAKPDSALAKKLKAAKGDAQEAGGAGDDALQEGQAVIDEFVKENHWHSRQQEIQLRKDRDGECFLRFFTGPDGSIRVRFIEPGQVETPQTNTDLHATFGIVTDPDDVETVVAYYVDEALVEASEIQHRKANVDRNVKRGLALFYPVRRNLNRAEGLLKNMSVVAGIQSAIAMIRKHGGGGKGAHEAARSAGADVTVSNSTTGKTSYYRKYDAGTIIDAPANTEYDFPATGIDAAKYVVILQAELRAIASRLVMPEFMLTSDASNANYSSTMVAEGPAVKMFGRLQHDMIEDDLDVMDRVLDMAVETGRLSAEVREQLDIDVTPPQLTTRDRKDEIEADAILVNQNAMSIETLQLRNDLDPEYETELIDAQREKMDPFDGLDPFGQQNPPFGKVPKGESKGDDDDDSRE